MKYTHNSTLGSSGDIFGLGGIVMRGFCLVCPYVLENSVTSTYAQYHRYTGKTMSFLLIYLFHSLSIIVYIRLINSFDAIEE